MTRTLAASMRRMNRLMRPPRTSRATRSLQKAITGFMVKTALAPLSAAGAKVAKPRTVKPRTVKPRTVKSRTVKPGMAGLKLIKPRQAAASKAIAPRIPDGAQYLTRNHICAAGSRSYQIYLPAGRPPEGLVLMLHGCAQTPDDFAVGTRINALAEKHGLAIAYPAQTRGHNRASCWNWFKPAHQSRGFGEPAILASLTRKLMREFSLDRDAVFVAGLSAGGAMAAILADVYPDIFSAAGIHSGMPRGAARGVVSAISAMRKGSVSAGMMPTIAPGSLPVRRIVFQGDADRTVHPSNAATIVAAAVGTDAVPSRIGKRTVRGRGYARSDYAGPDGGVLLELWMIEGSGHAWSGGRKAGSFTDSKGPDASVQMIRFFLADRLASE
jgi:poly(hydroxyalkanoate) depolymerase family esterase